MTLGCYGSAVEILERLELWEELALCYIATDRRAKAKRLILQQLEVQTTPSLLCLLGDITQVNRLCQMFFFNCSLMLDRTRATMRGRGRSQVVAVHVPRSL